MTDEAVKRALHIVYGGVPQSWSFRLKDIATFISNLGKLDDKHEIPATTYLIYARQESRFDLQTAYNAIFSTNLGAKFKETLPIMKEEATIQVKLDVKNMESEVKAFGSLDSAITNPHLDISPVYRYTVAIQQSLLHLIDEDLVNKAIILIRRNPYLFWSYGADYIDLMPISWEAI